MSSGPGGSGGGAGAPAPPARPKRARRRSARHVEAVSLKQRVLRTIDGSVFTTVMSVATVYALYGDDIRLAAAEPQADVVFDLFTSIAFFLFAIELILQCWVKDGYLSPPQCKKEYQNMRNFYKAFLFGSFYFWLDLVATGSLVPEIPWMVEPAASEVVEVGSGSTVASGDGAQTARAGRASRAGARAGRVVRVIRLVRLFRVVKVYKYIKEMKKIKEEQRRREEELIARGVDPTLAAAQAKQGLAAPAEGGEGPREDEGNSRVGAALSDLTTRRVIVGVLVMLIGIPFLMLATADASDDFALSIVHANSVQYHLRGDAYAPAYRAAIEQTILTKNNIVRLCSNGALLDADLNLSPANCILMDTEHLRGTEMNRMQSTSQLPGPVVDGEETLVPYVTEAWFDIKTKSVETALWSMLLTTFVIIVLGWASMLFSRDAQTLVLTPIEQMVKVVSDISQNPLAPITADTSQFKEGMETTLLLRTIKKIGGLLRVGFGEAGAAIIAGNLNESAELNPLAPGKKVNAIFGFCDIRKFTDTTECLQQQVMLFVNRIADVVHGYVVQHRGAANKNIGDAFLLAWKFDKNVTEKQLNDAANADPVGMSFQDMDPKRNPEMSAEMPEYTQLADLALMSFLKCMAESCRSPQYYDMPERFLDRLYGRMPGYKVRMGFGLDRGWAIEGAIGSDKKIDASYLSQHVKMSERLEGGTKLYGVPLLMTRDFFGLLSPTAKHLCRQVDHVTNNGEVIDLFTYDIDLDVDFMPLKAKLLAKHRDAHRRAHRRRKHAGDHNHHHHHHHHHQVHGGRAAEAGGSDEYKSASDGKRSAAGKKGEAVAAPPDFHVKNLWEYHLRYSQALWWEDDDLVLLRHKSTPEFRRKYEEALAAVQGRPYKRGEVVQRENGSFQLPDEEDVKAGRVGVSPEGRDIDEVEAENNATVYVADWRRAGVLLDEANALYPGGDGACAALKEFLEEYDFVVPETFDGSHHADV